MGRNAERRIKRQSDGWVGVGEGISCAGEAMANDGRLPLSMVPAFIRCPSQFFGLLGIHWVCWMSRENFWYLGNLLSRLDGRL